MNRHFFSKMSFTVALIGTLAAFSSNQASAECWDHFDPGSCGAAGCKWSESMPMCGGDNKACTSSPAIYNEGACRKIHGCYWMEGHGFCSS